MSLLMDALRRAEREKQAREQGAAAGESPAEPQAEPGPLVGSEDATVQLGSEQLSASENTPAAEPPDAEADDADDSRALDLEALADRSMTFPQALELEADETSAELSLEPLETDADALGSEDTHSEGGPSLAELTGGTTALGAQERSEQTATMPSSRAVEKDLEAYFERSQSMEVPRSPASADLTLEDVAAHTVVGAQTVFAAGERPRSRPLLVAVAVLAVVLVVAIGAVGVFYAQQSTGPRFVPPPSVADGVERGDRLELPVVALESSAPRALPTSPPRLETVPAAVARRGEAPHRDPVTVPAATAAAPSAAEAVAATAPVERVEPTAPRAAVPSAPAAEAVPPAPAAPPAAPAPARVAAQAPLPAAPSPPPRAASGAETGVGAGQVRIARARPAARVDARVASAYAAYQAGDFARAETDYQAVLAEQPANRDARLGLGALARARGDLDAAYRHYAAVLQAHPDDAVASTALFSLTGGRGPASAARLRLLLDAHADAPWMHFALANHYARQGRWPDAQQAYFDAVRLAPDNPDYAYNLAVSLEHLGQGAAALDYYQKSLALADEHGASFNPAVALDRINALGAARAE